MSSSSFFCALTLSVVQFGAVVLVAPLISGFRTFMSARLTGVATPPLLRRWYLIVICCRTAWPSRSDTDLLTRRAGVIASIAAPASLATVLTASVLVPTAGSDLITAHWSDFFVITLLLLAAQFTSRLPALNSLAETATRGFQQSVSAAVIIPSLFLMATLFFCVSATTNLDIVLSGMRNGSDFGGNAPFVLAAGALLAAAAPESSEPVPDVCGPDRAMLMLACDCIFLVWLTLAGDFLWPDTLALISGHASAARNLGAIFTGFFFWMLRCTVLCIVLASGSLIVAGPAGRTRLKAVAALLLSLFAIQVLFSSHLSATAEWAERRQQTYNTGSDAP